DTASPGKSTRLSYAEIRSLRISYAPSRFDRARYRCEISTKSGATFVILSTHYAGVGDFEDRAATYVPLMRGLIARVALANPAARFFSGKKPLVYVLENAFLLAMFMLLALALALVGDFGWSGLVWLKLALLAAYIPIAIHYTRKNWPKKFF